MVDPESDEKTADNRNDREPSRYPCNEAVYCPDGLEGDPGLQEDFPHQQKQGNRRQRELNRVVKLQWHQDQANITINEQRSTKHVGSKEGKGHGQTQEHRCADRAEQQGECQIPFHVSETHSGFVQIGLVRLVTRPAKP